MPDTATMILLAVELVCLARLVMLYVDEFRK